MNAARSGGPSQPRIARARHSLCPLERRHEGRSGRCVCQRSEHSWSCRGAHPCASPLPTGRMASRPACTAPRALIGRGVLSSLVCAWAAEHGETPWLRIVVCGHAGDWEPPAGWQTLRWKRRRVLGSKDMGDRERLWCSPACLRVGASESAQGMLL